MTRGWRGGAVPYTWSGGHGLGIGPTDGNCRTWPLESRCLAAERVGVDCSGMARWAYALAYGRDVLGPYSSGNQMDRGTPIKRSELAVGDLVFYRNSEGKIYHVAIYIGDGKVAHTISQYADPSIVDMDRATGGIQHYRRY